MKGKHPLMMDVLKKVGHSLGVPALNFPSTKGKVLVMIEEWKREVDPRMGKLAHERF